MTSTSSTSGAVSGRDMANALRILAVDAIELAASGHPGIALGAADIITVLFSRFVCFDAQDPHWPDRDRFVLSAGHGSALLYALFNLLGYEDMPIEELQRFRRLDSRAAGHPEHELLAAVEATTGPLGQGLAAAVGMAIAERHLAARFGDDIVDHRTWVLAGDGDLMEGISQEALSLAGHLKLGKLTLLHDDNRITIDGDVALADSTNQLARFAASNWHVQSVDGHDHEAIAAAIEQAMQDERPSLISCRTTIGFGAPSLAGSAKVHGAPLGPGEVAKLRAALNWPDTEPFKVPTNIRDAWRLLGLRGRKARNQWQKRLDKLTPRRRAEFERRMAAELPADFRPAMRKLRARLTEEAPVIATRQASGRALEVVNQELPETIGGSADLSGSNNTRAGALDDLTADGPAGRYLHYGVREHAMAAIMNGLALHGGVIPYGGTFLVFSDYMKAAIRLAALMRLRVIHVLTHDSIGVGEDGPTHQPVEHLAGLRAMPRLLVFRPADAVETAECWQLAVQRQDRPSVLALTRQPAPPVRTRVEKSNLCLHGAYELAGSGNGGSDAVIFASGSEVALALKARQIVEEAGFAVRVVSVPCMELFDEQDEEHRRRIIGGERVRAAIEAGVRDGWWRFIGRDDIFIGMRDFGASAPAGDLFAHFGITAEALAEALMQRLRAESAEAREEGSGT
ncbi:MAG TPA: transketolase [Thermopetrobacter sp.]|nr:transketolase [Thermopetrobacter sp.]